MLATLFVSLALAAPGDVTFDHLLVLPPSPGGSRTPFRADPVQDALATGTWHEPAAGTKLGAGEWTELKPGDDGSFEGRALAGGYALATFDAPADGVMILEAAGNVMVYVNPGESYETHTGDVYENGSAHLPIHVKEGHNALLFAAGRGHLACKLTRPPATVYISAADATLPDLLEGATASDLGGKTLPGAVMVVNATDQWLRGLDILTFAPGSTTPLHSAAPDIPPLTVRKVPVAIPPEPSLKRGEAEFSFAIASDHSPESARVPFKLRVRNDQETRKVTFVSAIDGSVQYFGYNPPKAAGDGPKPADKPGLILSLHGASVEAAHQAECYSLKPWAALAAATNRRPYGFDWEDWGRLDALEVLALAKEVAKPDPARIWLTGHSMGGHGTWINGVTYPDHFAAIAPSAGWTTFWSYGGANHFDDPPANAIDTLFRRAMNPGDTISLVHNLGSPSTSPTGVYILHGNIDDNVPVEQARHMRKLLGEFHPDFAYHEQPGANHWWGNQCMDWPPLMDFLERRTIPAEKDVHDIHFTTANPAVSASCYWATIVQQAEQGEFSTIDLSVEITKDKLSIKGTTTNVAMLAIDLAALGTPAAPFIELDGTKLDNIAPPQQGPLYLTRGPAPAPTSDVTHPTSPAPWSVSPAPSPDHKSPLRAGPFKHAFNDQTVLVYGTHGTAQENAWMLAKARLDAETIWYRGNGCFDVVADTEFASRADSAYKGRSVVLYGNDDINAAWDGLLHDSPLIAHRGGLFIGEHEFKDERYAALFVRPRPGDSRALIGAVAFAGQRGARALERTPYFSSGVAYPDWTIVSSEVFTDGMKAVQAAGYFGNAWELDENQSAYLVP